MKESFSQEKRKLSDEIDVLKMEKSKLESDNKKKSEEIIELKENLKEKVRKSLLIDF